MRRVAALLCLVPWLAWAVGPNGEEDLFVSGGYAGCNESTWQTSPTTDCACSETLDYTQTISSGLFDPTNSGDSIECKPGGSFVDNGSASNNALSLVSGEDISGQFGSATRVLETTDGGGALIHTNNIQFTGATFCCRAYEGATSSFDIPNSDSSHRYKLGRFLQNGTPPTNHPSFEASSSSNSNGCDGSNPQCSFQFDYLSYDTSVFGVGDSMALDSGSPLRMSDMRGHMNRIEYCFDHNWDATNHLRTRVKHHRVDNSAEGLMSDDSPSTNSTVTTGSVVFPAQIITPNWTESAGSHRYFGYIMCARKYPADPTFWIGPAEEIEGGAPPATPGITGGGRFSISDLWPTWQRYVHQRLGLL